MTRGTPPSSSKRLDVHAQPCLDLLVEDYPDDHVARVPEHEHEDVRLAQSARLGVEQSADAAEVHLGDLAGCGLDRDRDVRRTDTLGTRESDAQSLDRGQAAFELDLAQPERVVDRGRSRTAFEHFADPLGPLRGARRLLRWGWFRRQSCLDRFAQALELGQRVHVSVEQARTRDRATILSLGVAADPEQTRQFTRRRAHTVEANEFLEAMHVDSTHAGHRARRSPVGAHFPAQTPTSTMRSTRLQFSGRGRGSVLPNRTGSVLPNWTRSVLPNWPWISSAELAWIVLAGLSQERP